MSKGSVIYLLKQRPTTLTMVLKTHPDPPVHLDAFMERYGDSQAPEILKVKEGIKKNTDLLMKWWDEQ